MELLPSLSSLSLLQSTSDPKGWCLQPSAIFFFFSCDSAGKDSENVIF
jgi:hypothetical protein